jgi:hypothetical protein
MNLAGLFLKMTSSRLCSDLSVELPGETALVLVAWSRPTQSKKLIENSLQLVVLHSII